MTDAVVKLAVKLAAIRTRHSAFTFRHALLPGAFVHCLPIAQSVTQGQERGVARLLVNLMVPELVCNKSAVAN